MVRFQHTADGERRSKSQPQKNTSGHDWQEETWLLSALRSLGHHGASSSRRTPSSGRRVAPLQCRAPFLGARRVLGGAPLVALYHKQQNQRRGKRPFDTI